MQGRLAALYRHPVKGFTPESMDSARLEVGRCFPCDRLYAVEDGPSGFDPDNPRHISKMRFAVLAKIAEVARVRTRYDAAAGELLVEAEGQAPFRAVLTTQTGRVAFADWLQSFLGEAATGPLRVLTAPGDHRFMDDPRGFVSVINLQSVRDLEAKVGQALDPMRFRANLYVDGWDAWSENAAIGGVVRVGEATARVLKPIGRCRATHVDPHRGVEDIDLVSQMFNHFGHTVLGIYLAVEAGGRIAVDDEAVLEQKDDRS